MTLVGFEEIFDEIKVYLPKYLSPTSEKELFSELKGFPENIDSRLYTRALNETEIIYQGDGLSDLLVVNLPDTSVIKKIPSVVLSNTCDVFPGNERLYDARVVYSPIIKLDEYERVLLDNGKDPSVIGKHLENIRKQFNTSIFFLPRGSLLKHDSIIFLDRLISCDGSYIDRRAIRNMRLFSLSQYGHYLFVLKLSIHFSRIMEKVDRGTGAEEDAEKQYA